MTDEKQRKFDEAVARTRRRRELKATIGTIAALIFIGFFWYMYMFGSGTESCTAAYVNGKYGEGRDAVEQLKDECGSMTKNEALDDVTRVSNNINPSETNNLRADILTYW